MRLAVSLQRIFLLLMGSYVLSATAAPANKLPPDSPESLPYGAFPSIHTIQETQRGPEDLKTEIKDLSKRVESTVKSFATRRTITCFDSPCLVQAFPLLYNSQGSGFFGGFRANVTNIARTNPNLYAIDTSVVRSDTKQWLTYVALDLPKIESLPLDPRLKIRANYSRSTQNRFFGIGEDAVHSESLNDDVVRYSLKEVGVQSSIVLPIARIGDDWDFSVFSVLSSIRSRPSRLDDSIPSKLYQENPLGSQSGGTSSRFGLGLLLDNRDREVFSREGWAVEASAEVAGPPLLGQYKFQRYSWIDRRYWSAGSFTLASRITIDSLHGDVPFWELSGVGGIDPIRDVSGPFLLRSYSYGRFHEKLKIIWSLDNRFYLAPTRLFGMVWETMFIPLGIDLGELGPQTAWSLSAGANFLLNKSFLVRTLAGYASTGFHYRLAFGQEY